MSPFRLAWLDLIRHRAMTSLALASLTLTVAAAGILFRLQELSAKRFQGMVSAGEAMVGAKTGEIDMLLGCMKLEGRYPDFITYRLYSTLMNQHRIGFGEGGDVSTRFSRHLVPILFAGKYGEYRLIGTTEAFLKQPEPGPQVAFKEGNWPASSGTGVVVGAAVARRQGLRVGQEILVSPWTSDDPLRQSVIPHRFEVTGILKSMGNAWDGAVFTEMAHAQSLLAAGLTEDTPWGKTVLHYIIVYLHPGGMDGLHSLINNRTVAQSVSVQDAQTRLEDLSGTGRMMGALVVSLTLLLGGLSMAGWLIGRLEARARTLAVLRAMGFRSREVMALFAWESLLLGSGACALGGLLDGLLFPLVRGRLGSGLPPAQILPSPVWHSWPIWLVVIASVLLIAGFQYWRSTAVDPRTALQRLS